jgi:O-antigen/teichoic acid export membrane protein
LLLLGRVIAMAVNLLTQVLIVRYLTKADFGAFAYALSFVAAARVVVTLGHERTITRFLTLYEEERAYDKLFGTLIMEVVIICGMGAVLLLGTLLLRGALVGSLIDEPTAATILWIILLMAPLDALNRFTEGIFAVFSHPRAIFARRYILSPLLRISVVLALIAAHGSGVFLATGYVLASLIGLAFSFWPLLGILRGRGLLQHFNRRRLIFPVREIFGFTVPLLSTELVVISMSTVTVALLGSFAGARAVAELLAIRPAADLNLIVFHQFTLLFMPLASRLYARGDGDGMREAYWQTAIWLALLTFPIFAMTFVFAEPLTVTLFGIRYAESAAYLTLLAVGQYCNVCFGFNSLVLEVYGRLRYLVVVNVAAALLNILLGVLLIRSHGAMGAAVAGSLTLITQNILNQAGLGRRVGVGTFSRRYAKVYSSIALSVVLLWGLNAVLSVTLAWAVSLTVLTSASLLAFNREVLSVSTVFPELLRVPGLRRLVS